MTKILLLSEIFPPKHGGSGRWFWELYSRLNDFKIHIITHLVYESDKHEQVHPAQIDRMVFTSQEWGLKSLSGLCFYLKNILKIAFYIIKNDIKQIHCGRVLHEGFTGTIVSILLRKKLVIYVHGEDVETCCVSREHNFMAKFVFKHAHLTICNSQNSLNILKRLGYDISNDIRVLHPGADMKTFIPEDLPSEHGITKDWKNHFVVLTVGRLQARKGQDMMIRAVAELRKSIPNILYCIVGAGETYQALLDLVSELSLQNHVIFLPKLSDAEMLACYQQCDLFVLPNRTIENDIEGFGMVLVEAQACQKPVIAGDSGGTSEAMLPNETGFILDCTSPDALIKKISNLYKHPEHLIQMGEKGHRFVNDRFNWQNHAQKAQQLFMEL